ncbi:MAG: hypothetical protein KY456_16355 [Chloroflexi bacterium]|nr:hypothetical protein [Chloroflexota bacterium]
MAADRFDTLSRELTARPSRRAATTAVLDGMLGLLGLSDTGAKKQKGKGKGCVPVGNGISRCLPGTELYQLLTPGC